MRRHATLDELACLQGDALKPRQARKIQSHVSGCAHCIELIHQLSAVPDMLASASMQYTAMPQQVTARIESALVVESTQRLAGQPATEAGRRDLPVRSNRTARPGKGWRLPGLSAGAMRVLAAAGALVVIVGGGYEVATHVSSSSSSPSSASNRTAGKLAGPQASKLNLGPSLSFRHGRHIDTVKTVRASTNFVRARLLAQTVAAIQTAARNGVIPSQGTPTGGTPEPSGASTGQAQTPGSGLAASKGVANSDAFGVNGGINVSQMAGCVGMLAAIQPVILVELAKYEGQPAAIIVLGSTPAGSADVWVMGMTCSASNRDVLYHLKIPHI